MKCVNDYIINFKFIVLVVQVKSYLKLIFNFSYIFVIECCKI